MNDSINIGDYGQFSAAINRVDELNTQLEGYQSTISGYNNTLSNQDVFAGPLADSAIQAFTTVNTMISSSVANFGTIKSYVDSSLTNYQNADSSAVKYLDIKDGKIVESTSNNALPLTSTNNSDLVSSLNAELGKRKSDYNGFHDEAWCADFVSKMLKDNGYKYEWSALAGNENEGILKSLTDGGAELHYGELAVQRGVTTKADYTPQPGDVFTIDVDDNDSIDHTGFIIKDNGDGTVTTLEGNTYKNGQEYDGGIVEMHTDRKKSEIYAYATPSK